MTEQDFYTTSLCDQLRELRLQHRLSDVEMASRVGVKPEDITLAQTVNYALACGYSPLAMKLVNL